MTEVKNVPRKVQKVGSPAILPSYIPQKNRPDGSSIKGTEDVIPRFGGGQVVVEKSQQPQKAGGSSNRE